MDTLYLLSELKWIGRDSTPQDVENYQIRPVLPARFFRKVRFDPSGCWIWLGSRWGHPDYPEHAYGQIRVNATRRTSAHVFAYEMVFGPVPAGMELDHLCHTKLCVNPQHLEPVTHRENIQRIPSIAAARLRGDSNVHFCVKTHCINGHPFIPQNTYIPADGRRRCRACNRERARTFRRKVSVQ